MRSATTGPATAHAIRHGADHAAKTTKNLPEVLFTCDPVPRAYYLTHPRASG
jgi:hypothetical protein